MPAPFFSYLTCTFMLVKQMENVLFEVSYLYAVRSSPAKADEVQINKAL